MRDLRTLVKRGKIFKKVNIKLESNINDLSPKKQIELKALELFQIMDQRWIYYKSKLVFKFTKIICKTIFKRISRCMGI